MNRRSFLGSMVGGIATATAVRSWPFRVFSFPEKIVLPSEIEGVVKFYKHLEYGIRGEFPQLLAPGLRQLFVEHFDFARKSYELHFQERLFDA